MLLLENCFDTHDLILGCMTTAHLQQHTQRTGYLLCRWRLQLKEQDQDFLSDNVLQAFLPVVYTWQLEATDDVSEKSAVFDKGTEQTFAVNPPWESLKPKVWVCLMMCTLTGSSHDKL